MDHESNDTANSLTSQTSTGKPSIACSFPVELIEATLLHLNIPPLIIAAAHLPPTWRDVVETSSKLRERITSYSSWRKLALSRKDADGKDSAQGKGKGKLKGQKYCSYRQKFANGMLYVHSLREGEGEGFIFCPVTVAASDPSSTMATNTSTTTPPPPLKICNPETKVLEYVENARFGHGYLELRDMGGEVVCSGEVNPGEGNVWVYARSSFGKRGIRRKRVRGSGDVVASVEEGG